MVSSALEGTFIASSRAADNTETLYRCWIYSPDNTVLLNKSGNSKFSWHNGNFLGLCYIVSYNKSLRDILIALVVTISNNLTAIVRVEVFM